MSKEKPGLIRRSFRFIGKLFSWLRTLIQIVFLIILVIVIVDIFGSGIKPLPEKSLLTLVPSGMLVEQRSYADPFTQIMEQSAEYDAETPIRDLIDATDAAATDPRITGLVIDLNHFNGGGISKIEEVGAAINRFKTSGKPVIAVSNNYDQQQYLLASFADEIHLNPMGGVLITGFGAYGSYFKDAIDKLRLNVHIFRVGEFKSAVEPFIRNDMSPQARENALSWLNNLWRNYTGRVETQRNLPNGAVDQYVNTMDSALTTLNGNLAELAKQAGLVDEISTLPEFRKRLLAISGGKDQEPLEHKLYLTHQKIVSLKQETTTENAIGVIVASGNILDGKQPEGQIGGDTLAELLQIARKDSSLKALVLRIDSPGGSAFASEVIRQEILRTRKKMPVIISMSSLAASGGYWVSADADEVWATPNTLTGSIGVFGLVPTFEKSLEALGIHSDGVGTTLLADSQHLDRELSPQAKTIIQLSVEHIYQQFLDLVASGRQLPRDKVDAIAQGRVWSGEQALEIGLVDKLGFFDDAITGAAEKANIENWKVKYISRPLSFQEQLLKQLAGTSAKIMHYVVNTPSIDQLISLSGYYPTLKQIAVLETFSDSHGVYAYCATCIDNH